MSTMQFKKAKKYNDRFLQSTAVPGLFFLCSISRREMYSTRMHTLPIHMTKKIFKILLT